MLYAAINAWAFPREESPARHCERAAEAGFAGIELTVSADGPFRFDTPLEDCGVLAKRAAELRIRITSLASGDFFQTHFASSRAEDRQRAREITLAMLERADVLGAGAITVIPAVVGRAMDPVMQVGTMDAMRRAHDALSELRSEAEGRGVTIGLENVWNRFLLSPTEAADFVDRVNSPHVGWCLDTGNVVPWGYPQDWIITLGGRITRVHAKDYDLNKPGRSGFCMPGDGSVDWGAVAGALTEVGYRGPLIYEGGGDVVEARRRLERLIAGEPILG